MYLSGSPVRELRLGFEICAAKIPGTRGVNPAEASQPSAASERPRAGSGESRRTLERVRCEAFDRACERACDQGEVRRFVLRDPRREAEIRSVRGRGREETDAADLLACLGHLLALSSASSRQSLSRSARRRRSLRSPNRRRRRSCSLCLCPLGRASMLRPRWSIRPAGVPPPADT